MVYFLLFMQTGQPCYLGGSRLCNTENIKKRHDVMKKIICETFQKDQTGYIKIPRKIEGEPT